MEKLILVILSIFLLFKAQSQTCSRVCNSDFENSVLATPGNLAFVTNFELDCWNTTAFDGVIEVWGDGCEGVSAYSGQQFIELNANVVSTLYQDISVVPGETFVISFAHRGRWGTDILSLSIRPIGGTPTNLGNFSAGSNAWEVNDIAYTFPNNGVSNYRLEFNSVSSSGGMPSVGNFLDAISVTSANVLTLNLQATEIQCNPSLTLGSINASVVGSIGNLAFTWSPNVSSTNSASNLLAGNYSVIVMDSIGCTDTAQVSITGDIPNLTVSSDVTGCSGTVAQFFATGNGIVSWNNGIQNGIAFTPPVGTTEYIASVTLSNGCQISDTVKTIIFPNPIPDFSANTREGCESLPVIFTNLTLNTQQSVWNFGNGETSSLSDQVNTNFIEDGSYSVALTVTDQNGCIGTSEKQNYITVFPKPIASFSTSSDYFGFEVNEINFENNSVGANHYIWKFSDIISTEENLSYNFSQISENIIINLNVSNQYGCKDSTSKILAYKNIQTFYVPNTFTPDGNKFNNTFSPVFPSNFTPNSFRMRIYSRWGTLIFETFDHQKSWDGSFKNEKVQDGSYCWEIIFQDENLQKKEFRGHLSLLK